jgi:hypothetical protein
MSSAKIQGVGAGGLEEITSTSRALDVNVKSGGTGGGPITPTTGVLTDRSGTLAAGGVAQTVCAANGVRKYFLFENVSTADLWINFTTAAVIGEPSIRITPKGSLVMESSFISTEAVSVIGATISQAYTAKES